MKKKVLALCLLVGFLSMFNGSALAKQTLKAAGGQIGGGWYTIVSGLAEIINTELKDQISLVVVPGSGVSNVATCSLGDTPITMSFPPFIMAARQGMDPYDTKYPDTLVIATNFGFSAQHFVTTRDDMVTYKDMADKKLPIKITLNKPGATDEFIWRKVMGVFDLSYEKIKKNDGKIFHVGHGEAVQLTKDGHADTHFSYISVPSASITEMAISRPLVFVELPKEARDTLQKDWSLAPYTIPAGTYKGQTEDLETLSMANTLMINAKTDEGLVYNITKTLCEHAQEVQNVHKSAQNWIPEVATKGVETLLHPGAEKYYREKGYLK
ncbi:TAXI family TRAP transporter solute-binding subunit [Desulfobacula sp.]|uniref:TAXI family TRAP transporter solute-binding subunit n=1 Tax=Desulfobacula sp. TaxID=2593537 RepID=UPI002636070E|nr:TAXI family TRAP transporter solute-binding subunit [Desulfobacula sp.]